MRISVLGTGNMGAALARCLIGAGHEVTVWNRTPARAAPLGAEGAQVAASADAALDASDLSIVCIAGHGDTLRLIEEASVSLTGKTVCDMSSGATAEAEELMARLEARGARGMLGMINAYPSGIGKPDTAILTVGPEEAWADVGLVITTLGGASARVGAEPSALAALFAALFTVRQGFMFGMIYGALACRKAGIPMEVFSDQIPASIKLVHDYHALFARTVPDGRYDAPEASLAVYARAQEDALNTVEALGAPDALIRLIHDRTRDAVEAGYSEKELTALVEHMGGA